MSLRAGNGRGWGGPDPPFLHPSPPPTASLWKWPRMGSKMFGPDPDKGNIPAKARMQNCHVKAGLWFRAIFSESLSQEWDLQVSCSPMLGRWAWGLGMATSGGAWTPAAQLCGDLSELCARTDLTCPAGRYGYLQFCIMRSIIWIVPLG